MNQHLDPELDGGGLNHTQRRKIKIDEILANISPAGKGAIIGAIAGCVVGGILLALLFSPTGVVSAGLTAAVNTMWMSSTAIEIAAPVTAFVLAGAITAFVAGCGKIHKKLTTKPIYNQLPIAKPL
jgi:hypothetical protein